MTHLDQTLAALKDKLEAQKGLKSLARGKPSKGVTLANYQDIRIRHFHRILDRFLNA